MLRTAVVSAIALIAVLLFGTGVAGAVPAAVQKVATSYTFTASGNFVRNRYSTSGHLNRKVILVTHWTTNSGEAGKSTKAGARLLCFTTLHWHCKPETKKVVKRQLSDSSGEVAIMGSEVVFRRVHGVINKTHLMVIQICVGPEIGACAP